MTSPFTSIRTKLFFWFITSLVSIAAFFFLAIHILKIKYGIEIFFILLAALAIEGYYIIRKITQSLTKLSSKIKTITSKNLDERITDIESQDEVGELATTFNQLLDRLDQSFKREQQFIGDVAHELKTPLATLRSSIEVALSKNRSVEEYKKLLLENIIDINRLSSTLKNVLDLAWSEAGVNKRLSEINLSELIEELKELGLRMAYQKQISFSDKIELDVKVHGEKEKLLRALLNVVDNAVKYTPIKGKIHIGLTRGNDYARITIRDTGMGILKEDLDHIFDRFYRGSKQDKTFGSGLGLAISQGIITSHRGNIKVSSKINQGTVFTVLLPLNY